MKSRIVVGVVLFLAIFTASAQAAAESAEDVVKHTTDQVLARIASEKAELNAHPERVYDLIHKLVIPHFDFDGMSKWVLGRAWVNATPEQRKEFIKQFQTLLVRTYAKALLEYSNEKIRFLPVDKNPGSSMVVVKTEVHQQGGAQPVPIHYRMHMRDGHWKVVDVAVDGVSLVSTYRGSFASEIRKSGLNALIAKLTERNQKLSMSSGQGADSASHQ
jgi:phospholipid transport system substrate-binding protein